MKIRAGGHHHIASDGQLVQTDLPLSQTQVDLIVQLLAAEGLTTRDVIGIDMDGETPPVFHRPYGPWIGGAS